MWEWGLRGRGVGSGHSASCRTSARGAIPGGTAAASATNVASASATSERSIRGRNPERPPCEGAARTSALTARTSALTARTPALTARPSMPIVPGRSYAVRPWTASAARALACGPGVLSPASWPPTVPLRNVRQIIRKFRHGATLVGTDAHADVRQSCDRRFHPEPSVCRVGEDCCLVNVLDRNGRLVGVAGRPACLGRYRPRPRDVPAPGGVGRRLAEGGAGTRRRSPRLPWNHRPHGTTSTPTWPRTGSLRAAGRAARVAARLDP
ncbi:hypothetical protein QF037_007769 [Streptomyces canus]|nr:hypothetical protein [Streptomyces canus]